jgi:hypothetical protein
MAMARFLALIYDDEQKWAERAPETVAASAQHRTFMAAQAGSILGGNALQPTSTATSLTSDEEGSLRVTDGPYVETKEALGGYYLLEAADLDAAVELAREIPAPFGAVEVRPIWELSA